MYQSRPTVYIQLLTLLDSHLAVVCTLTVARIQSFSNLQEQKESRRPGIPPFSTYNVSKVEIVVLKCLQVLRIQDSLFASASRNIFVIIAWFLFAHGDCVFCKSFYIPTLAKPFVYKTTHL